MRILHVSDTYLPRLGGLELHVRDLAARQRAAGHHVEVATRTVADAALLHAEDDAVLRARLGSRRWLADTAADLVHAHASSISPFALAAARRAARTGVPTVITVHSMWRHIGRLPPATQDLLGVRLWPVVWSAVSERAAQPVRQVLGVPVHVVPNAVDLDVWAPPRDRPDVEPPRVISVMRIAQSKRAVPLVRVLQRVGEQVDLRATVVGDGPARPAVERYLRRHRLTDRVRLTGVLDRAAIPRELAKASVFVAPAHQEAFGIAALEARASGLPVLASARSGVATFVEHGRDGLLAVDDQDLADQLVTMLRDRRLREQIALHNRRVKPAYGWPEALVRNDELYRLAGAASLRRHRTP